MHAVEHMWAGGTNRVSTTLSRGTCMFAASAGFCKSAPQTSSRKTMALDFLVAALRTVAKHAFL